MLSVRELTKNIAENKLCSVDISNKIASGMESNGVAKEFFDIATAKVYAIPGNKLVGVSQLKILPNIEGCVLLKVADNDPLDYIKINKLLLFRRGYILQGEQIYRVDHHTQKLIEHLGKNKKDEKLLAFFSNDSMMRVITDETQLKEIISYDYYYSQVKNLYTTIYLDIAIYDIASNKIISETKIDMRRATPGHDYDEKQDGTFSIHLELSYDKNKLMLFGKNPGSSKTNNRLYTSYLFEVSLANLAEISNRIEYHGYISNHQMMAQSSECIITAGDNYYGHGYSPYSIQMYERAASGSLQVSTRIWKDYSSPYAWSIHLDTPPTSIAIDRKKQIMFVDRSHNLKKLPEALAYGVGKQKENAGITISLANPLQKILQYICTEKNHEYLACLAQDNKIIVLEHMLSDQPQSVEIDFNGEIPSEIQVLSNELMLVKTDKSLHVCNFVTGDKVGKINIGYGINSSALVLSDKKIGVRYDASTLGIVSLSHLINYHEISEILIALKTNISVKTLTLSDKHMHVQNMQYLYDLVIARPDIEYHLSDEIKKQLDTKKSEEDKLKAKDKTILLREEEAQKMQLQHLEEKRQIQTKFDFIEKIMQEMDEKREAQRREENQVLLSKIDKIQTELNIANDTVSNLQEELMAEKTEHQKDKEEAEKQRAADMKQMTLLLKAGVVRSSAASAPIHKQNQSLAQQIAEAKLINEELLNQLTDRSRSIEDINLIRFSDDEKLLKIKDSLLARKAILSFKILFNLSQNVNNYTDKEHVDRLILAMDQLLSDYALLPNAAKQDMQSYVIDELVKPPMDKLRSLPQINEYYTASIRDLYKEDEEEIDIYKGVPKSIRSQTLRTLFENPTSEAIRSEITAVVRNYVIEVNNKLKQCKDPMAAQISSLIAEQEKLKREIEILKNSAMTIADSSPRHGANAGTLFAMRK